MSDILLPAPPRESGWEADDLDVFDLPPHTELLYGVLNVMMSPQRTWHAKIVGRIERAFDDVVSDEWIVAREQTVRIGLKDRPEPDVMLVRSSPEYYRGTTWFRVEDVAMVVEVESPESEERDRELKPMLYAKAGVPRFLRVSEDDDGSPVIHEYRLDNGRYGKPMTYRESFTMDDPVRVTIALRPL